MTGQVFLVLGLLTLCKEISSARAGCRSCVVNGKEYQVDDEFTYTDGCWKKFCECQCTGWPSCPKEKREYICQEYRENEQRVGETAQQIGCKDCNVYNVYYRGGQQFSYRQRCIVLNNCMCNCDGSWKCASGQDICTNKPLTTTSGKSSSYSSSSSYYSSSSSSSSLAGKSSASEGSGGQGRILSHGSSSVSDDSACRSCNIDGRVIESNTKFTYRNDCIEYSECFCYCSGSWKCPAESAKSICAQSGSGGGRIIGADLGDCRTCDVYGSTKLPNTDFTYRNGCNEWTNCRCNCDGSWNCPPSTFRWKCDNVCRKCEVDGKSFDGNSEFIYQKDCITYNPCQCYCNGSWDCPAETGSWSCSNRCRDCKTDDGRTYTGNTTFKYRKDCWEWDSCNCNCDGSWKCPSENARWACQRQCRQCEVQGRKINGNSDFQIDKGCWQFNCRCDCDGSWNCPAKRTVNTCNMNSRTGCHYCNVHGKKQEGNTYFSHTDGCIEYSNCLCNCDGSWECPGEKAVDTCRKNTTTGCYSCELNGQRISGNSKFHLKSRCWEYQCECGCNGKWECNTSPTDTCSTEGNIQAVQCRACYAAGRRYESRSSFEMQWGCVNYACQCHCDGQWECPAINARVVCDDLSQQFQQFQIKSISSLPHYWCSPCRINDSLFPGNSQFEYVDGCYKHFLRCYCNGGFRVASSVIPNCASGIFDGSIALDKSSAVFLSQTRKCRTCIVNGASHSPRSSFELRIGCMVYRCQCRCSGQPSCQAGRDQFCGFTLTLERSETQRTVIGSGGGSSVVTQGGSTTVVKVNTAQTGTNRRIVGSQCYNCIVDGNRHPGNSMFDHKRGCIKYRCQCDCRGVAICRAVSRECSTSVTQRCRTCQVEGKQFAANSRFTYQKDCKRVSCRCECDGTANCVQTQIANCRESCVPCMYEGVRRAPYSQFYVESTCERLVCQCNCNGNVRCAAPIRTCNEPTKEECRGCTLLGKYYRGGSDFRLEYGPWILPCKCLCGGYPKCDRSRAEYIEQKEEDQVCRTCKIDGREITSESKFTREQGCYLYRCQCFCDGSHNCVSSGIYTCGNRNTETTVTDGGSRSTTVVVKETTRTDTSSSGGISTSTVTRGTSSSSQGTTSGGSSTSTSRGTSQGSSTNRGSSTSRESTTSKGSSTSGGSSTSRGSSSSSSTSSSSTTSRGTSTSRGSTASDCKPCKLGNKEYPPKETFSVRRGCMVYRCDCYCNGRYGCRRGKNACAREEQKNTNQTSSEGDRTDSSSSSSDRTETSTFNYEVRQSRVVSTETVRSDGCRNCRQGDDVYQPNSEFNLDDDCKRFRCRCNCDGSWICPRQRPTNICQKESCRECIIRGRPQKYQPNSSFTLKYDDCRSLRCNCSCDGRYQCEREWINTCQESCTTCSVGNKQYQANTRFIYREDCNQFDCDCYCNGTYNCPASRTKDICNRGGNQRGQTDSSSSSSSNSSSSSSSSSSSTSSTNQGSSDQNEIEKTDYIQYTSRSRNFLVNKETARGYGSSGCYYCKVYEKYFRPNNQFQFDEGCWRFTCDCNCDGSWNCPASRTIDKCGGTRPAGQCRNCRQGGKEYPPNAVFELEVGCYKYNCDCACDGSFNCPAQRTKYICGTSGNNNRCRKCNVGGALRESNRRFQYDEGCYRYDCDCNCDGSWNCPAERTINTCTGDRERPGGCRKCNAGGALREPNRKFQYDEGCYRYNCDCNCDGSWNCPAERIINKCDRGRQDGCKRCNAGGALREPNSRFAFTKDCVRYDCDCKCDGSWNCPSSRSRNACGTRNTLQGDQACEKCKKDGKLIEGNTRFDYTDGCAKYNCECSCDGVLNCIQNKTESVCNDKSECKSCLVKGENYRSNTRFQYIDGCEQLDCDCNCDGSWDCPSSRKTNVCEKGTTQCKVCQVKGTDYPANSTFVLREKCLQYQCKCDCDGSWTCPTKSEIKECNEE